VRVRVEHADVGVRADGELASGYPQYRRRPGGHLGERLGQRDSRLVRPLEREGEQKLQPCGPGLGFGEGKLLRVLVDGRVIRAKRVDCAIGERRAERVAVPDPAEGRHHVAVRVEVAQVDL
jgi:hypothetical protein